MVGGVTRVPAEQQPGPGRSNTLWLFSVSRQVAALELDNVYMKYMLVVVALVMVGHLVVRRFFRP